MNTFRFVSKILFLLVILFSFSCSSANQGVENQNLQITKVEPLAPITSVIQESDLPTNIIPNPTPNIEVYGEITDEVRFQGRDMSQYNKANTSKCNSYKCIEKKMRTFIWEHWRNKKRGYIANEINGIDVTVIEHIFVEPNENGEWTIAWRVERHQYPGVAEIFIDDVFGRNSVEQVRANSNKNNWKLVFKDKDGKIIKTL